MKTALTKTTYSMRSPINQKLTLRCCRDLGRPRTSGLGRDRSQHDQSAPSTAETPRRRPGRLPRYHLRLPGQRAPDDREDPGVLQDVAATRHPAPALHLLRRVDGG